MPGEDIGTLGKDMFYEIGDDLFAQKEKLEGLLFHKERELFPHSNETNMLELLKTEDDKISGILLTKKQETEDRLYGCYVLESTHTGLTDKALWKLYMTLSKVEGAFRAMKCELGMRPVYHQTASRTESHLFITVLAYHLLATIENLLGKKGDHRQWSTLRIELSTHTRSTVILKDKDGNVYHTRVSGAP